MIWETIPVLLLLVAAGGMTALFALIFWRTQSFTAGSIPLVIIMAAVALWSWSFALGLASGNPFLMILARVIEYAAIAIIPVAFVQFSLLYSGKMSRSSTISWVLLLIIPAVTVVLLIANWIFFPVVSTVARLPVDLSSSDVFTMELVFWILFAYASLLMLSGLAIIIRCYQSPAGMFRGQLACMLIATLPPLFLYWAYAFRISPFGIIDLAPISCIISVVALTAGIERYGLFDIIPVEYGAVLRQIPAGIVVLDVHRRIVEINPAALRILGIPDRDLTGTRISDFLPLYEVPVHQHTGTAGERRQTIQRELDGTIYYIDIRCIPLRSVTGEHHGHVMVLTDATDQMLTEQSLAMARKNINLLTGITRHDILNQLTLIVLHNEILKEAIKDPALAKSLHEQERAARNITRQIAFTKDYEKLGENLPQWLDIQNIFRKREEALGYDYILYSVHVEGLEVFADPLLERVFYNLLDNSLRYGEKVTGIRLRHEQSLDGLTIIYEDNGVGIPTDEKNRIFRSISSRISLHGVSNGMAEMWSRLLSRRPTGISIM